MKRVFKKKTNGRKRFLTNRKLQNKLYREFCSVGFPRLGARQIAWQLMVKKYKMPVEVEAFLNKGLVTMIIHYEKVVFKAVEGKIDFIGRVNWECGTET